MVERVQKGVCVEGIRRFRTLMKQAKEAGNREAALRQVGEGLPETAGGRDGLSRDKQRVINRIYPEPKV